MLKNYVEEIPAYKVKIYVYSKNKFTSRTGALQFIANPLLPLVSSWSKDWTLVLLFPPKQWKLI